MRLLFICIVKYSGFQNAAIKICHMNITNRTFAEEQAPSENIHLYGE